MSETVAIIGCGLIGRAWAIVFARAGCAVRIWDASPEVLAGIGPALESACREAGEDRGILSRITAHATMAETLEGASWVQENGPEKLDVKKAIYAELDAVAAPDAILASSSSALVASQFAEGLVGRGRILVAHPVNPPHVIPVVELCPSPDTAPETMNRAGALMRKVGQVPVPMSREIDGFILNRLQGVLLAEALRLVDEGIVSVDGLDDTLRHGLARRWVLLGALGTIHLNAPGGVADYLDRYGPTMARLADDAARGEAFTAQAVEKLAAALPGPARVAELSERRDRQLTALARFLDTMKEED